MLPTKGNVKKILQKSPEYDKIMIKNKEKNNEMSNTAKAETLDTDANSCYDVIFTELELSNIHTMTKAQTHLIESTNSSIRDNLARFNRKTKCVTENCKYKENRFSNHEPQLFSR